MENLVSVYLKSSTKLCISGENRDLSAPAAPAGLGAVCDITSTVHAAAPRSMGNTQQVWTPPSNAGRCKCAGCRLLSLELSPFFPSSCWLFKNFRVGGLHVMVSTQGILGWPLSAVWPSSHGTDAEPVMASPHTTKHGQPCHPGQDESFSTLIQVRRLYWEYPLCWGLLNPPLFWRNPRVGDPLAYIKVNFNYMLLKTHLKMWRIKRETDMLLCADASGNGNAGTSKLAQYLGWTKGLFLGCCFPAD